MYGAPRQKNTPEMSLQRVWTPHRSDRAAMGATYPGHRGSPGVGVCADTSLQLTPVCLTE